MCTRCASNAKDDVPADNFAAIIFVSIMSFVNNDVHVPINHLCLCDVNQIISIINISKRQRSSFQTNRKGDTYSACTVTEQDRVEMSLRQPQSMQNYTELGFKKIRAPEGVSMLLLIITTIWLQNFN